MLLLFVDSNYFPRECFLVAAVVIGRGNSVRLQTRRQDDGMNSVNNNMIDAPIVLIQ